MEGRSCGKSQKIQVDQRAYNGTCEGKTMETASRLNYGDSGSNSHLLQLKFTADDKRCRIQWREPNGGGCDSENVKRNRCCPERIKFAFAKMHFIRRIVAFGMGNVHTSIY